MHVGIFENAGSVEVTFEFYRVQSDAFDAEAIAVEQEVGSLLQRLNDGIAVLQRTQFFDNLF